MSTRLLLTSALFLCLGATPDPPQATISNGLVAATLYLPDAQRGYYRGTRFDGSGAFKSLEWAGHRYVEQWFEKYDPKTHDAINGPVEEFVALGHAEARVGETFVKIGVGVLRRPDEKTYTFSRTYDVVDPGRWSVETASDRVEFRHELADSTGYAYRYAKTVRLTPGKPELVLEHRLENRGRKPIETSVYNHNFFIIDHQPTGPGVEIRFPFAVQTGAGQGFGSLIRAEGNQLVYARDLAKGETVYSPGLHGFGPTARDYEFWMENRKTGAGLRATGDQPLEKLVFWACATTSCPEPYLRLSIPPGEVATWKISYDFYQKTTR